MKLAYKAFDRTGRPSAAMITSLARSPLLAAGDSGSTAPTAATLASSARVKPAAVWYPSCTRL